MILRFDFTSSGEFGVNLQQFRSKKCSLSQEDLKSEHCYIRQIELTTPQIWVFPALERALEIEKHKYVRRKLATYFDFSQTGHLNLLSFWSETSHNHHHLLRLKINCGSYNSFLFLKGWNPLNSQDSKTCTRIMIHCQVQLGELHANIFEIQVKLLT